MELFISYYCVGERTRRTAVDGEESHDRQTDGECDGGGGGVATLYILLTAQSLSLRPTHNTNQQGTESTYQTHSPSSLSISSNCNFITK